MRLWPTLIVGVGALAGCGSPRMPSVSPDVRAAVQARAGAYPLREIIIYDRDSAYLFLEDSSLTRAALDSETWMFGPPVTSEEAGSCPAHKVLGQRLARELWWRLGADTALKQVVVRVKGTRRDDQLAEVGLYYYLEQFRDPWVGDTLGRR